jgi:hypothetical protein
MNKKIEQDVVRGDEKIGEELAAIINKLPTLEYLLPFQFPWGQTIGSFEMSCSSCKCKISGGETRVDITTKSHYVFAIRMYNLCQSCCSVTISDWRYSADQILIKVAGGWQIFEGLQNSEKHSLIRRIFVRLGWSL